MKWLDGMTEHGSRGLARNTSRRGFLGKVAAAIAGGAATIPLLPIARGQEAASTFPGEEGDPNSCEYWRYCAIDGFLCGCCGGSPNSSSKSWM